MKGIVDRLEGDRVILELEDGNLDFDKELFPENIKEGDIVEYLDNKFVVNEGETMDRKAYIDNMFSSLINKEE